LSKSFTAEPAEFAEFVTSFDAVGLRKQAGCQTRTWRANDLSKSWSFVRHGPCLTRRLAAPRRAIAVLLCDLSDLVNSHSAVSAFRPW